MLNNIEIAELTISLYDGNEINLAISKSQLAVMLKVIGFEFGNTTDTYTCYSDDTLKRIMSMKGNPLRLKPVDDE